MAHLLLHSRLLSFLFCFFLLHLSFPFISFLLSFFLLWNQLKNIEKCCRQANPHSPIRSPPLSLSLFLSLSSRLLLAATRHQSTVATPLPPPLVELEVDGKKVAVEPGTALIRACEEAGVEIPRFCYHERLAIAGNCRMCLVEVERLPSLLPRVPCLLPLG